MNYEEIVAELDAVIKNSEKAGVTVVDKLEEALSLTENKEAYDLIFSVMGMIQEEDLLRQKIERVMNSICEVQGIDPSKYNIAPSAKHIAGDKYEEMSQKDIDNLFKNK